MNNADVFKKMFGIYAEEFWSYPKDKMLEWLQYGNVPDTLPSGLLRCKDCKWYDISHPYGTVIPDAYHCKMNDRFYGTEHFCAYGERRE